MLRTILGSKIHRATVTQADLDYVGSVTIDADLVKAAGLIEGEKVSIVDVTNGSRLETYVITGAAGSGHICINGAAAHLINPGDLVIIMSYLQATEPEARSFKPRIVHVDSDNRIISLDTDPGAVIPGSTLLSSRSL